ncbi:hypothetical protein [Halogeometricum sp. CBA1124]|uniref:hypothetical protein n=1 Tax=Halogeometricum sp. CBA1124 TaxID=2668071 RepID=UPI001E3C5D1F|nr:hypothetical protein [Halogeometricum sp. CBA1124]
MVSEVPADAVDAVGDGAEFVVAAEVGAFVEVTRPDAPDAAFERLQRSDDVTAEEEAMPTSPTRTPPERTPRSISSAVSMLRAASSEACRSISAARLR